jgi:hypothetical protein
MHDEPTPARRPTRIERISRWLAALAMAGSLVSCTVSASAESSATSLAHRIARSFEGAQLDVWGGGTPKPGSTTSMFFHHGTWAAEVYWTTDGWCLSRVYDWSVVDAVNEQRFSVEYRVVQEFPSCVNGFGHRLLLKVAGDGRAGDRSTFTAAYVAPFEQPTVRTICSTAWDDPSPCGFPAAAVMRPNMQP